MTTQPVPPPAPAGMSPRTHKTLQALILAGLGIFLLEKIWSGDLYWYINNRFMPLIFFTALGFLLLAQSVLPARRPAGQPAPQADDPEHEHDHDHKHKHEHEHEHAPAGGVSRSAAWGLLIVAVPVLLGVLVPAKPLGASAISNKGMNTSAPLVAASGGSLKLDVAPQDRNILDWIRAINVATDPTTLNGQRADVIGFVYQDSRLGAGQFLVGRFTITCCVADALAIGMAVRWKDAASLPANSWVQVKGAVEAASVDGQRLPRILADSVESVPEPTQPYLYP